MAKCWSTSVHRCCRSIRIRPVVHPVRTIPSRVSSYRNFHFSIIHLAHLSDHVRNVYRACNPSACDIKLFTVCRMFASLRVKSQPLPLPDSARICVTFALIVQSVDCDANDVASRHLDKCITVSTATNYSIPKTILRRRRCCRRRRKITARRSAGARAN